MLEPLPQIHLDSATSYDFPRGNRFYIYAFAAIAVFVLAVASINYMNLATARSTRRAKEVGMRKVLGATRGQLVAQFVGDCVVYSLVSLTLGLLLAWLILQFTNITVLLDAPLSLAQLLSRAVMLGIVAATLALGVISGL